MADQSDFAERIERIQTRLADTAPPQMPGGRRGPQKTARPAKPAGKRRLPMIRVGLLAVMAGGLLGVYSDQLAAFVTNEVLMADSPIAAQIRQHFSTEAISQVDIGPVSGTGAFPGPADPALTLTVMAN